MKRRDLLKMVALAPAALLLPKFAPAKSVSELDSLALEGAKRLRDELVRRGIRIDEDKQVQFYRYKLMRGALDQVEKQDHPFDSTYACDDTSIFDLDRAVKHIADKLLTDRDTWAGDSLRFYPQSVDPDILEPEFFPQAWHDGVFMTAHKFIAANTGREVTMLEVWCG